ncbi:hypothetical protein CDAR_300001 [Caerostris darwini]|uniref:Uncharacterized protein n=1 Tax=Caerostris darwini TaxID=1538125 RepID=A0AAV4W4K2_9ARAC|nr:hypothetical protein CDAR_300001 [Caerostris darwini]
MAARSHHKHGVSSNPHYLTRNGRKPEVGAQGGGSRAISFSVDKRLKGSKPDQHELNLLNGRYTVSDGYSQSAPGCCSLGSVLRQHPLCSEDWTPLDWLIC